ncbi:MAG: TIGR04190 family B12-binding domain/radical SAM domain protein [Chloroflexota bacterium]|nr:TIGR04190 family B12-binding domain/radical SAM domain protein [Chloroflexota bacterium]
MPHTDLILLHAPSVYDFRTKTILFGPVSDLIPSSPIFELYPLGFAALAEYLEGRGHRVRIVNLAVRMLRDPDFDAERQIAELEAPLFGIDLHWMLHCHGAIEVARLVKRHHPQSKLVLGGFSSSYYHRELFDYPEIDFVLRGDSTEEPLRQLVECIAQGREPEAVPNLSWRDAQGQVHHNPLSCVPYELDDVMVDHYGRTVRSVVRDRDLANYLPFRDWLRYPITAVLTSRGCRQNCIFCGGSAQSFRGFLQRERPAYRTPEAVARDVKRISSLTRGPIFILGDIRQPGEDYAHHLLDLLAAQRRKNRIIMELFEPAPRDFLKRMGQACPGFCLEISPESHDPQIRKAIGRDYSTEALEDTIAGAMEAGCERMDVFFMIGLPQQTPRSVLDTIDFCADLLKAHRKDGRFFPFIAPLSPFLDPGSPAFEHPERHGYRLRFRTVEEHRQALLEPSWKYALNYETEWMERDDIARTAYDADLRLNRAKARYGYISDRAARAAEHRLLSALEIMQYIDQLMASGDLSGLAQIKEAVDWVNMSTAGGKVELELPTSPFTIRALQTVWAQTLSSLRGRP